MMILLGDFLETRSGLMGKTVSDQVIEVLVQAGVRRAFGVPGDATNLLLNAIHSRKDIEFVLVRHEEGAGFMAN